MENTKRTMVALTVILMALTGLVPSTAAQEDSFVKQACDTAIQELADAIAQLDSEENIENALEKAQQECDEIKDPCEDPRPGIEGICNGNVDPCADDPDLCTVPDVCTMSIFQDTPVLCGGPIENPCEDDPDTCTPPDQCYRPVLSNTPVCGGPIENPCDEDPETCEVPNPCENPDDCDVSELEDRVWDPLLVADELVVGTAVNAANAVTSCNPSACADAGASTSKCPANDFSCTSSTCFFSPSPGAYCWSYAASGSHTLQPASLYLGAEGFLVGLAKNSPYEGKNECYIDIGETSCDTGVASGQYYTGARMVRCFSADAITTPTSGTAASETAYAHCT